MLNFFKTNGGTLLGAALGAVITALITIAVTGTPEGPRPQVKVSWISFPADRFGNEEEIRRSNAMIERLFQTPEIPKVLSFLSAHRDVTAFLVEVTNKTDRRTKEVEINGEGLCCHVISSGRVSPKFTFSNAATPLVLPALDPGQSAKALIIGTKYSYYQHFPLQVLSGGAKLFPSINTLGDDFQPVGVVSFFIQYPYWADFVVILLLIVIAGLLIGSLYMRSILNKFDKLIAQTPPSEMNRIVRFADYIRRNQASKLEPSIREFPKPDVPPSTNGVSTGG